MSDKTKTKHPKAPEDIVSPKVLAAGQRAEEIHKKVHDRAVSQALQVPRLTGDKFGVMVMVAHEGEDEVI